MKITTTGGVDIEFKGDMITCLENGVKTHSIANELPDGMDIHSYLRRYQANSAIFSPKVLNYLYSKNIQRKGTKSFGEKFKVGNIEINIRDGDLTGPANRPQNFVYPLKGDAGAACLRVARAVKYNKSVYLYGPAGTGKSDLFRALAHDMNMEFSLYPMREDLDTALYLGQTHVVIDPETGNNKTEFKPGRLLEDIKGRIGKDGILRPVMIVVDDIDRAPAEYHEVFRHILDGTKGVFVPELGTTIDVLPGTLIVATANSRGRGDDFGTYTSVQSMDDSILDRFGRFVEYHYLNAEEEKQILKSKYPLLDHLTRGDVFDQIMKVTDTIRTMISNREIYIGFSHRILVEWCESVLELVKEEGEYKPYMIRQAAEDWAERYDFDTRKALVERVLNIQLTPVPFW